MMGLTLARESEFLRDLPLFYGLPQEDMEGFIKSANLRTYSKNEHIYHQDDPADMFFVVMDGWVRLYRETIDGDESVSDLLSRGQTFGEGIIFYQSNSYIFSAQAAESTRILEISKAALKYRAEENPDILKRIMNSVCEKMIRLQSENERLARMNAAQRAACLLLRLSARMIGNGGTFTFPYDKSLAAAQLGMKRETFSRALTNLKPIGVPVAFIRKMDEIAVHLDMKMPASVITDLEKEPQSTPFTKLACKYGIKALWAQPIKSSKGKALGVFTVYYDQPHTPYPMEEALINQTIPLMSTILSRHLLERAQ